MPAKNLKCPKCATVVVVPEGQKPVCSNCGFGSSAPAAAAAQPSFGAPAQGYGQAYPQQAYGQPAYGGVPAKRPGMVTTVAVLEFIGSAFALLAGFALLILGLAWDTLADAASTSTDPEAREAFDQLGDIGGVIFVGIGAVLLILGTLGIFVGVGLLRGRAWARMTAIVLAAINILLTVVMWFFGQGGAGDVLGIGIQVMIIVFLLVPKSAEWFRMKAAQPRA